MSITTIADAICLTCALRKARKLPPRGCVHCDALRPVPLYARAARAIEAMHSADIQEQHAIRERAAGGAIE